MEAPAFYRLTGPTEWAGPPETFSYSSLKRMAACLRQWQLASSRYGDLARCPERPNEAAELGVIVHEMLSRLFHTMAVAGYPELGTEAFRVAIAQFDILGTARRLIEGVEGRAASNPRALGFRFQATARDVYNKVSQAFRQEYTSISAQASRLAPLPQQPEAAIGLAGSRLQLLEVQGFLSEEEIRHPRFPIRGFIDLVVRRNGRTVILDFKTGASQPQYREQLLLYALMWWRKTGDLPAGIELRYGARVEAWPITDAELVRVEEQIEEKIRRYREGLSLKPAAASLGPHCTGCGARQFCDDYWQWSGGSGDDQRQSEWVDLEVVIQNIVNRTGFVARDRAGRELAVVCDEDVPPGYGRLATGGRLRLLNVRREDAPSALRITRTTEVFGGDVLQSFAVAPTPAGGSKE
ncbi:RecB family exonuclease [Sorangium sp. So ce176]|uniref:RecB family exonuclease n=1 Tax=Sorangium sp. So ce176 TaxID=3133286 RepID=UPI003F628DF9